MKIDQLPNESIISNHYDDRFGRTNKSVGGSIEKFAKLLYRLKFLLGGWIGFCLLVALAYINFTPPIYTATGTVLLDPRRSTSIASDSASLTSQIILDNAQAESQLQVVRSERLLSKVFETLSLENSEELHPRSVSLRNFIGSKIAWLSNKKSENNKESSANETASAFQNFMSRVNARRVGQSYVIEVSYTSSRPSDARKLANAVLSAYLGQQISYKLAAAQNGAEYLQGRLTSLTNQIKAADQAIEEGRVPNNYMPDADARIIGAAPEPLGRAWPKNGLIIAAALAFGLFTGVFLSTIYGSLDKKIWNGEQLEEELQLEVIVCELQREARYSRLLKSRMNEPRGDVINDLHWSADAGAIFMAEMQSMFSIKDRFTAAFASCDEQDTKDYIVRKVFDEFRQLKNEIVLMEIPGLNDGKNINDLDHRSERISIDSPSAANGHLEFQTEVILGGGEYISARSITTASVNSQLPPTVVAHLIASQAFKTASVLISVPDAKLNAEYRACAGLVDCFFIVAEIGRTKTSDIEILKKSVIKSNKTCKVVLILVRRN